MLAKCVTASMAFLLVAVAVAQDIPPAKDCDPQVPQVPQVPEAKRTVLGLYVTAREAYEQWNANRETVKILDVRTPEEYYFVGHPAMARNIPLMFLARQWDGKTRLPVMKANARFVEQVKAHFKPGDTILIMCRSGVRSKCAVDRLAKEGYKHLYNIVDGMEGDSVKDTESVFVGKRMRNGWKNSGAPWTYEIDPKLAFLVKPR